MTRAMSGVSACAHVRRLSSSSAAPPFGSACSRRTRSPAFSPRRCPRAQVGHDVPATVGGARRLARALAPVDVHKADFVEEVEAEFLELRRLRSSNENSFMGLVPSGPRKLNRQYKRFQACSSDMVVFASPCQPESSRSSNKSRYGPRFKSVAQRFALAPFAIPPNSPVNARMRKPNCVPVGRTHLRKFAV